MKRIQVSLLKFPKDSLDWLRCNAQNMQKINLHFPDGEFPTRYNTEAINC